jgi:hypothetical protein
MVEKSNRNRNVVKCQGQFMTLFLEGCGFLFCRDESGPTTGGGLTG